MAKFNYAIDATLLPEVWVTWESKNGRIWMNNEGKRQTHPESWMLYTGEENVYYRYGEDGKVPMGLTWHTRSNSRIWVSSGSTINYAYAKYHPDIDRLEMAIVTYDTTRREGTHEWSFAGDRLFIGRDKSVLNQNGDSAYSFTTRAGYYSMSTKYAINSILHYTNNDLFIKEFKKLLGTSFFIIGNGNAINVEYTWHISQWYESVQKTRTTGKAQRLVDELTKMSLGEISHLSEMYKPKYCEQRYGSYTINNIIYFEKINDEWSVLRGLLRKNDGSLDEAWRVYLGSDGTNRIAAKSNREWVPSNQQRGWSFSREYYFANPEEAIEKCNRIKYIMPLVTESENITTLITTLRFPQIEQLYKLGCNKMALSIANSSTPKASLKEMFGGYYKEKENGILRQVGMNKHQLEKYYSLEGNRGHSDSLKKMRQVFGDDLSNLDNNTFDRYLVTFNAMLGDYWTERLIDALSVDMNKFWRNLSRLGAKNNEVYRLVKDTMGVHNRLANPKPEVNWLFDSYSDVVRAHDALTALYNEQEAERRAYYNMAEAERRKKDEERRKKVDAERKLYEYEDDNFIIRLPKDIQEIVNEGTRQHICIGGYTTSHSRGDTNLFFLRRKNDETTPFYAIEMNTHKSIVQIHGFGNKWLGNDPDAIPTVIRWLRKHDIKCDASILTCTARGYGKTADYVPMPVVD
jgi:hypothetical protein